VCPTDRPDDDCDHLDRGFNMTTSTLRKIIGGCTLALGLALVPSVQAQQGGGTPAGQRQGMGTPAERAEQQITQLTTALALTPDQVGKIRPILVKQYTDQAAVMAKVQQGGDMAAVRTESQAVSAKAQAEIAALLTAEQGAKYTTYLEEMRSRRGGGMGGQGNGGAPRQQ
jgi:Spy/CpxP family protein refolding chaperone